MPRYFFHFRDDFDGDRNDLEGTLLADAASAKEEAVKTVGEMMRDAPARFVDDREWCLEVMDETELMLFSLRIFIYEAPALSGLVIQHPG